MKKQRRISASSFRQLLLCPHALFLDHHGDPGLKTEMGEFENYLLDEGKRFEVEVLEGQTYVQPSYPKGHLEAGTQATLDLMEAGHGLIYQGVLMTDHFVGIPDLLVKKRGKSVFGGWYYEPRDIKTAKSVKDSHILQLCLYAMILEEIQGRRPQAATIILAGGTEDRIDLAAHWATFEKRLNEAISIVGRKIATELAISSGCGACSWEEYCHAQAVEQQDVSLVAGLRRNVRLQLVEAGIRTIRKLSKTRADVLSGFHGVGETTAQKLVRQAKSQLTGKAVPIRRPDLSVSPVELYYDIEGEPNVGVDYLHGLLTVRKGKKGQYASFVAEDPAEEANAFTQFVTAVSKILDECPKTPIYHYHSYERAHVRSLFEKYPKQALSADELLERFVDLHKELTSCFVLPLEGYGLKLVSKWLGFKYRNTKSSAGQSMLWYRLWLDEGKRQYLDDSITYNEDDCRATHMIKEWMTLSC